MNNKKRVHQYRVSQAQDGQKRYYAKTGGKWTEVTEAVFRLLDSTERRQQYLDARSSRNKDVSIDALSALMDCDDKGKLALLLADRNSPESICVSEEAARLRQLLRRILPRCIKKLPAQDRALIEAMFYGGVSESDYARRMGIDRKGVYNRKKRILAMLRKDLIAQIGFSINGGDLYDE